MNRRKRFPRSMQWRLWLLQKLPEPLLLHPFPLFICMLSLLFGLPLLFGSAEPTSMAATIASRGMIGQVVVWFWGLSLVLGSATVVFGILRDKPSIERPGLLLIASGVMVYVLTIVAYRPHLSVGPAVANLLGFAVAALLEGFKLRTTKIVLQIVEEQPEK